MPSSRAILIDIIDRGLDPSVAHSKLDSLGRLKGLDSQLSVEEGSADVVKAHVDVEMMCPKVHSSPILSTPPLDGEDAERLLADLENNCSPEEAERRIAKARSNLAEMMRPKEGYLSLPTCLAANEVSMSENQELMAKPVKQSVMDEHENLPEDLSVTEESNILVPIENVIVKNGLVKLPQRDFKRSSLKRQKKV